MKTRLFISAVAALAMTASCSGNTAGSADSAAAPSAIADTSAVDTAAEATPSPQEQTQSEEQALEARIREIWNQIPTVSREGNPTSVMTPEFKKLYSTASELAAASDDMDIMEMICWIDYQDAAPGAKIEWITIDSIDGDNATATVKYKDHNIPEPHKLKLKRIGGIWLLDDFDTLRKTCKEIINLTAA